MIIRCRYYPLSPFYRFCGKEGGGGIKFRSLHARFTVQSSLVPFVCRAKAQGQSEMKEMHYSYS